MVRCLLSENASIAGSFSLWYYLAGHECVRPEWVPNDVDIFVHPPCSFSDDSNLFHYFDIILNAVKKLRENDWTVRILEPTARLQNNIYPLLSGNTRVLGRGLDASTLTHFESILNAYHSAFKAYPRSRYGQIHYVALDRSEHPSFDEKERSPQNRITSTAQCRFFLVNAIIQKSEVIYKLQFIGGRNWLLRNSDGGDSSIKEIIDGFDISVCQIALRPGERYLLRQQTREDIRLRRFRFLDPSFTLFHNHRRLDKYTSRGFLCASFPQQFIMIIGLLDYRFLTFLDEEWFKQTSYHDMGSLTIEERWASLARKNQKRCLRKLTLERRIWNLIRSSA